MMIIYNKDTKDDSNLSNPRGQISDSSDATCSDQCHLQSWSKLGRALTVNKRQGGRVLDLDFRLC